MPDRVLAGLGRSAAGNAIRRFRFYRLGIYRIVFDETYYVTDAYSILQHGVELDPMGINAKTGSRAVLENMLVHGNTHFLLNTPEYVVHLLLGRS